MLTAMIENGWRGLSVLYVCPLRALLNNLHPRVDAYAKWVGRTAGLWHGDTSQTLRRRMRVERPDIRTSAAYRGAAGGTTRSTRRDDGE
jgi:ATP-dependent Lhr-like helicase